MSVGTAGSVKEVRALRTGKVLQHQASGEGIEFMVPQVEDYEIAAITMG
jgi:hypothetical protein